MVRAIAMGTLSRSMERPPLQSFGSPRHLDLGSSYCCIARQHNELATKQIPCSLLLAPSIDIPCGY